MHLTRLKLTVLAALAALIMSLIAVGPATARQGPTNVASPSVKGKAAVGRTLTCRPGTWTGKKSGYRFAWKRDGKRIAGTSKRRYTVTRADRGTRLKCVVSPKGVKQRVASAAVTVVDAPRNTAAPTVTGLPKPGETLTCDPGTWVNDPTLRYSWTRDGSPAGTGQTRLTKNSDLGKRLVCLVAGSNAAGGSGFVASEAVLVSESGTDPVPTTAPTNTVRPSISGIPYPGEVLTCEPGTWTGNPTFTYSWTRNGSPAGTGATRTTKNSDLGTTLVCYVIGSNTAGGSGAIPSAGVHPQLPEPDHVAYQSHVKPATKAYGSVGYGANSIEEWGDHLRLEGGASELNKVTVTMASWSCVSGAWNAGNPTGPCVSTPGSTYVHPVTVNVYGVDNAAPTGVGDLITTVTVDQTIPYRPSFDPSCGDYKWLSPEFGCINSLQFDMDFNLGGVDVPGDVIVSVAFDTSGSPAGSLNVAAVETAPVVGENVNPDKTFVGYQGGQFEAESGWGTYTPGITLEATTPYVP
ncbi:hypothetical protein [Nocardioides sp.]|jgi:hypothetical protein|uniref:hypothetical protein n=1 Tax=Nocardioides sp. TaxID=35761 RepID=UPI001D4E8F8E|nr:hypothetical protein [Nocardioides sp.]MBU1800802.1 hypothetical protein [Actinomycetota bacterium]